MPPFAALLPQDDVYRAASNQTWIDTQRGKFLPDAFKLRKRDVDANSGLSVMVVDHCPSVEESQAFSRRSGIRAVCKLNVGQVRILGLDVTRDQEHHASINGLPFTDDETDLTTIQRVNDFAEELAGLSLICSP